MSPTAVSNKTEEKIKVFNECLDKGLNRNEIIDIMWKRFGGKRSTFSTFVYTYCPAIGENKRLKANRPKPDLIRINAPNLIEKAIMKRIYKINKDTLFNIFDLIVIEKNEINIEKTMQVLYEKRLIQE